MKISRSSASWSRAQRHAMAAADEACKEQRAQAVVRDN
jgi:hypothetical protein